MSDICNLKAGDLVRISPITSDLTLDWQKRVGLVLKEDVYPPERYLSPPPHVARWTCNFGGEIRSVSEKCLEKVQ